MNITYSTRTICCKVTVDTAADAALRRTQVAFNQATSYCATVAWEQGITNKNKLHHIVYGPTRANFDLGAQLACCARDRRLKQYEQYAPRPNDVTAKLVN